MLWGKQNELHWKDSKCCHQHPTYELGRKVECERQLQRVSNSHSRAIQFCLQWWYTYGPWQVYCYYQSPIWLRQFVSFLLKINDWSLCKENFLLFFSHLIFSVLKKYAAFKDSSNRTTHNPLPQKGGWKCLFDTWSSLSLVDVTEILYHHFSKYILKSLGSHWSNIYTSNFYLVISKAHYLYCWQFLYGASWILCDYIAGKVDWRNLSLKLWKLAQFI